MISAGLVAFIGLLICALLDDEQWLDLYGTVLAVIAGLAIVIMWQA